MRTLFPGRTAGELLVSSLAGAGLSLVASWIVFAAVLSAVHAAKLAGVAIGASLGVPLGVGNGAGSGNLLGTVSGLASEDPGSVAGSFLGSSGGSIHLPFTVVALVPLLALVAGGWLAARLLRARSLTEAGAIGVLAGATFALVLPLAVRIGQGLVTVPYLSGALYVMFWAVCAGSAGALLQTAGLQGVLDIRRHLTRAVFQTRASAVATSSCVALVAVLAAFATLLLYLVVVGGVVGSAIAGYPVALFGFASIAAVMVGAGPLLKNSAADRSRELAWAGLIALLVGLVLALSQAQTRDAILATIGLAPTTVLTVLFAAQGAHFHANADYSASIFSGSHTFASASVFDSAISFVAALVALVPIAVVLIYAGRLAATKARPRTRDEAILLGLMMAVPWAAVMLILRQADSVSVQLNAVGISGSLTAGPNLLSTLVGSAIIAATCGAIGASGAGLDTAESPPVRAPMSKVIDIAAAPVRNLLILVQTCLTGGFEPTERADAAKPNAGFASYAERAREALRRSSPASSVDGDSRRTAQPHAAKPGSVFASYAGPADDGPGASTLTSPVRDQAASQPQVARAEPARAAVAADAAAAAITVDPPTKVLRETRAAIQRGGASIRERADRIRESRRPIRRVALIAAPIAIGAGAIAVTSVVLLSNGGTRAAPSVRVCASSAAPVAPGCPQLPHGKPRPAPHRLASLDAKPTYCPASGAPGCTDLLQARLRPAPRYPTVLPTAVAQSEATIDHVDPDGTYGLAFTLTGPDGSNELIAGFGRDGANGANGLDSAVADAKTRGWPVTQQQVPGGVAYCITGDINNACLMNGDGYTYSAYTHGGMKYVLSTPQLLAMLTTAEPVAAKPSHVLRHPRASRPAPAVASSRPAVTTPRSPPRPSVSVPAPPQQTARSPRHHHPPTVVAAPLR
jgi:hypothetical protein